MCLFSCLEIKAFSTLVIDFVKMMMKRKDSMMFYYTRRKDGGRWVS